MAREANNQNDERTLRQCAEDLSTALEEALPRRALRFRRPPNLISVETDTGGWCVKIATLGPGLPAIEVFLDRIAGGPTRCFWYGFTSEKSSTPVSKAIDASNSRKSREIDTTSLRKMASGIYTLRRPLTQEEAKLPVPEFYFDEDQFYFGIYDLSDRANVPRAIEFIKPAVEKLRQSTEMPIEKATYEFVQRLKRDRQPQFRDSVLKAYGRKCAITDCGTEESLEAAHINRFSDSYDDDVTNGILLRADLHRLLDAGLLKFTSNGDRLIADFYKAVADEESYRAFHGTKLRLPNNRSLWPSERSVRTLASFVAGRDC
jgi:hypothetical protein